MELMEPDRSQTRRNWNIQRLTSKDRRAAKRSCSCEVRSRIVGHNALRIIGKSPRDTAASRRLLHRTRTARRLGRRSLSTATSSRLGGDSGIAFASINARNAACSSRHKHGCDEEHRDESLNESHDSFRRKKQFIEVDHIPTLRQLSR